MVKEPVHRDWRSVLVDELVPLQAYVNDWATEAGGCLTVHTSCLGTSYDVQIVRVLGGAPKSGDTETSIAWREIPAACAGSYPAARRQTIAGSYAESPFSAPPSGERFTVSVWAFPTLPNAGRRQVALSCQDEGGLTVSLEVTAHGQLAVTWATGDTAGELVSDQQVRPYTWYFMAATVNGKELTFTTREVRPPGVRSPEAIRAGTVTSLPELGGGRVYVGILEPTALDADRETTVYAGAFNGKIEAPALIGDALDHATLARLALERSAAIHRLPGLIWSADFSQAPVELAPLRIVNAPMRRMTGHTWRGHGADWRVRPPEWAAVWFHDDDLDDAGWPESFRWDVPSDTPCGIYAVRISNELGEDLVPFFVRARSGHPGAALAFLAPTFSYTAYSNFWHIFAPETGYRTDDTSVYLARHPELGMSMYMRHRDGSGISHVSWRRPMVDMRFTRRLPTRGNAGREVSGDIFLTEWLEAEAIPYDVITDLDVHEKGAAILGHYACVVTGAHPEYVSREIIDALQEYVDSGGRLMYLGGNGFYWVTTVDPDGGYTIEVRRGRSGSRTWTGQPGEQGHTDGQPGGHWRDHGYAPQILTGVGFCAQGGGPGAGFARLPDSFSPAAVFVFDGIGTDEIIGDFGDKQGGAAADELDRADTLLGTPDGTLLLATSVGQHDNTYQHAVEEVQEMNRHEGGDESGQVRSDMTLYVNDRGGAVFSVGSISWSASLAHEGRKNNVARITRNVINHFTDTLPLGDNY
jgi:N,N-dimethylformamidase